MKFLLIILIIMVLKALFSSGKSESSKNNQRAENYQDPIEKAENHWDNNPEDLDMEDMFWLDELMGDD